MYDAPTESPGETRERPSDAADLAEREDAPTVIIRRGDEAAALVSLDTPRRFQRRKEEELDRIVGESTAEDSVPPQEAAAETTTPPH